MIQPARRGQPLITLVLLAVLAWTFGGLHVEKVDLAQRWPQAVVIFRLMFTETEWSYTYPDLVTKLVESLQMAIVGTGIAAVLAIPFGFLAARNMSARRWAPGLGKFLLNVIRTFPELILAIMFIKAVGPGPFAGVLAMGVHAIGFLGKLYAEVVEAIDPGVVEAMAASGASRAQIIWHGLIPQVLPEFASYAIYRFEIAMRSAAVMGMVGAGGIGTPLIFAVTSRDWGRVGVILIGVILLVTAIDALSSWLRSKLV